MLVRDITLDFPFFMIVKVAVFLFFLWIEPARFNFCRWELKPVLVAARVSVVPLLDNSRTQF